MSPKYPKEFYERISSGSYRSAIVMFGQLLKLVQARSIVDIGCGSGSWLRAARDLGVAEVAGIDGVWAAEPNRLAGIPFRAIDLARPPYEPNGHPTFDLALCMEMAEHVSSSVSEELVQYITTHSNLVLFSAAPPGQGGDHHINEQWPAYWARLFSCHGFKCIDWIRWQVWSNDDVEWWYRQNALMFCKESEVARLPELMQRHLVPLPVSVVHPRSYERFNGCSYRWVQRVAGFARAIFR